MRTAVLALASFVIACSDESGFELGDYGTLVVEPGALEIVIGETARASSSSHHLRLSNTGGGVLTVRDVRLEGADPSVLALAPLTLPFELAPGASPRPLVLVYTRADDRARTAEVVIASSDPLTPVVRVPVAIISGRAHLVVHPSPVVFDKTTVPVEEVVRLMNTGNAPLSVSRLAFAGPRDFTVATDAARTIVIGGEGLREVELDPAIVVEPGAHRELVVGFAPVGVEPVFGELTIYGDSANAEHGHVVDLIGNETGPCLLVRPPALAFGTKAPGALVALPVHLENCGTEDVDVATLRLATAIDAADPTLQALGVTAPSSARFTLELDATPTDAAPLVLAAGETHTVMVSYLAWSETELGDVAQVRSDAGALVVRSSAYLPVHVVPMTAATELVADPVDPIVPTVPGCEWAGGEVRSHRVAVTLTADNYYELWVNGELLASDAGHWANEDRIELDLDSGCHVIGIHAWGDGAVTAGMIAAIEVDDVVRWQTADARPEWSVTGPDAPPGDWHDLFYDDSTWSDPRACTRTTQWGASVDTVTALGARWVWWNPECDDALATAWFRLTFTVD